MPDNKQPPAAPVEGPRGGPTPEPGQVWNWEDCGEWAETTLINHEDGGEHPGWNVRGRNGTLGYFWDENWNEKMKFVRHAPSPAPAASPVREPPPPLCQACKHSENLHRPMGCVGPFSVAAPDDDCRCRRFDPAPAAPVREPGELPVWPFSLKLTSIASPESPADVVRALPALARRLGLMLEVDINDVATFVCPGDTPRDTENRYRMHASHRRQAPPAPKPGRARAMAAERFPEAHWSNEIAKLAEDVAREAIDALRDAVVAGHGFENAVYIAKAALLGDGEVKRG